MLTLTPAQRKLIRDRINSYRVQDKRKNRDYSNNVKLEQWLTIWHEQGGKCYYSGLALTVDDASLERIDCSIGHTYENTVLVLAPINFSRGNKSLIPFCKYLASMGLLEPEAKAKLEELGV